MLWRFGRSEERRPVRATVCWNVAWMRPSLPTSASRLSPYVERSFSTSRIERGFEGRNEHEDGGGVAGRLVGGIGAGAVEVELACRRRVGGPHVHPCVTRTEILDDIRGFRGVDEICGDGGVDAEMDGG